jgi:SAM-dependent methyltransferase
LIPLGDPNENGDPALGPRSSGQRLGPNRAWCGDPVDVPELAEGGFDVITMWSVLAHFADPVQRLEMVRSLLAPGGVLLIYNVNAQSLELKAYTHAWSGFTKNHLMFWEPETLTPLLRRAGFSAVAYRPFYGGSVETGTGNLTDADRARVIDHVDRYRSGAMMRAMAINGPAELTEVQGAHGL